MKTYFNLLSHFIVVKDFELIWSIRSSRPEVFCKKGVLGNCTKFLRKHLCQSLFFNKVAGLRPGDEVSQITEKRDVLMKWKFKKKNVFLLKNSMCK